jgi:hypothetical protein
MKVTKLSVINAFFAIGFLIVSVGCDQSPRTTPDRSRVDFNSNSGNSYTPQPYTPGNNANAVQPGGGCASLEACQKLNMQVQIGGAGRQVAQRADQIYWYGIKGQAVQWEFSITGVPPGRELFAYTSLSGPEIVPLNQNSNQFKVKWIPRQDGTRDMKVYVRDVARCELNAAKSNNDNDCRTSKSTSSGSYDFDFGMATVIQDFQPKQNSDGSWTCIASTLANTLSNIGGIGGDIFSGISGNTGSYGGGYNNGLYGSGYLGGNYLGGYNGGCGANGFNQMPYNQQFYPNQF